MSRDAPDAATPLDRWLARLADGEAIDWVHAEGELGETDLCRLRELAALSDAMRSADPSDPEPGQQWGHLELRGELGHGSFGRVLLAFDPTLQREVALKLRRADAPSVGPDAWIREARQLARVRHPNVLAVHGADIHHGIPGLWADRIDGTTLRERGERGALRFDEILRIARQLAEAVDAVHEHGLVHGDLKPGNVMIEPDGRVVLMDFGTARPHGVRAQSAGSPAVMSPERLRGGPPSRADDIHALGAIYAFLASGRYPFPADSLEALKRLHDRRPEPDLERSGTPRAWRTLLRSMLASEASARPTIGQVIERLECIRTAPARRRRLLTVGALFGVLLGGLAIAMTAYLRVRDAESETSAVNVLLRDMLAAPRATELGREVRVVDVLERAVPEAERRFVDRPRALARVRSLVGRSLISLGLPAEAEPLLRDALATYAELDGPGHPRTLAQLDPIARIESETGRNSDAEATWNRLLALADPNDPELRHERIFAHVGLAGLRLAENRPDAALAELDRALALPGDARSASAVQGALAMQALVLNRAGRADEAAEFGRRALAESLRINGHRHVNSLIARDRLIQIQLGRGEMEEAERLARENLTDTMDWLGAGERRTVMAQISLSNVLADRGRSEESLQLLRAAADAAPEAFGPTAVDPWVIASNLAARLIELDRLDEAVEVAVRVQAELEHATVPVGQLAWVNGLNLAEALLRLGRHGPSLQRSTDIHDRIVDAHGAGHPLARIASSYRAAALNGLGRPEEAEPLLVAAGGPLAEMMGADHPQVLLIDAWRAEALWRMGRVEDARAKIEDALRRGIAALGPDHYRLRDLRQLAERIADASPARR